MNHRVELLSDVLSDTRKGCNVWRRVETDQPEDRYYESYWRDKVLHFSIGEGHVPYLNVSDRSTLDEIDVILGHKGTEVRELILRLHVVVLAQVKVSRSIRAVG